MFIDEVSDHDDWKEVRNSLLEIQVLIQYQEYMFTILKKIIHLVLKHDYDGRDLDLEYADKVIEILKNIGRWCS